METSKQTMKPTESLNLNASSLKQQLHRSQLDSQTKQLLQTSPISSVINIRGISKTSLYSVQPSTTWATTIQFLEQNNILAVPVLERVKNVPIQSDLVEINWVVPECSDVPPEKRDELLRLRGYAATTNVATEQIQSLQHTKASTMAQDIITPEKQKEAFEQEQARSEASKMQSEGGAFGINQEPRTQTIGRSQTINKEFSEQAQFKFHGIVSVLDLLKGLVDLESFNKLGSCESEWINDEHKRKQVFTELLKDKSLFDKPVIEFLRKDRNQTQLLTDKDSILSLVESLTANRHWALIMVKPDQHTPIHLTWISQTDVVKWLNKNQEKLGDIKNKQMFQLINPPEKMYALKHDEKMSAIAAFKLLFRDGAYHDHDLNGVPIVDEQQRLVGNLSASDLRGITLDNCHNLLLPVLEYQKLRPTNKERQEQRFLATISPTATLLETINTLVKNDVHRVWVCNELGALVSVVSLTDICKALL